MLALQAGEVDMLDAIPVVLSPAIRANPDIVIMRVRSANHRQLHMRCDTAPFNDKRVRQALALSLDRKKLVDGLCRGMGVMGNDSPFAPLFPSTDPSVAQRDQDLTRARQLLAAAGVGAGFDVTLTTEHYNDIPEYAQLVQNFARALGIRVTLKVETQAQYYGKSVAGQSDWLDSPLGITDYAHRGVPNTLLGNPLLSNGPLERPRTSKARPTMSWCPVTSGRWIWRHSVARAHDIQTLLLDETPLIIGYFPDLLVAGAPRRHRSRSHRGGPVARPRHSELISMRKPYLRGRGPHFPILDTIVQYPSEPGYVIFTMPSPKRLRGEGRRHHGRRYHRGSGDARIRSSSGLLFPHERRA